VRPVNVCYRHKADIGFESSLADLKS